jgi:two-component system, OmpR family, sensor histidine kinase KdpD
MRSDDHRPSPDEILERVTREERKRTRGRLKVFMGFAAGVGKTYEMLNEGRRRRLRGEDVAIGFVETHGRQGTETQIGDLEVVPRKTIEYRGAKFEEMDTDAILARAPTVVLVDELAHTNVPGSEREKRWQDVEVLREAGINVLSTMNVQHLESLNDTIHDITGQWVRETVPDSIMRGAEEVMVDVTPDALINRLKRGDIYAADKVDAALRNWFRHGNLNALREIALREIAHEVDQDLTDIRHEHRIAQTWATHERIMVCVSPASPSMRLIRRGWRIAQRLKGDIVAVYVEAHAPDATAQCSLHNDFALADRLGVPIVTLHGDVATELVRYARENQITQIVVGHSRRSRWEEIRHGSIINRLTQELRTVDLLIVAAEEDPRGS